MKKIFSVLFIIYFVVNQGFAQDFQFSQFYSSPLTLNPALTGAFPGKYRFSTIYRDQWRGVTPSPFQTISTAIDLRFELDQKRTAKDVVSVGMVYANDKTSVFHMNNNQLLISGAFTKALTNDNTQFLTAAIQGGIGQRTVSYDNLNFPNEFNGIDKFNQPDYEKYPFNNIAYGDLSTGLNYYLSPRRGMVYHIGGAVHHLLGPNIAFFDLDKGGTATLGRKYTAHVNAQFPTGLRTQISPRFLFQTQNKHALINAGTNLRYQFSDYDGSRAMHFGVWARAVRNDPTKVGLDAVVGMFGFELFNFLVGFSYDTNINAIAIFGKPQNAFEISLSYLGNYENDAILCPKF